MGRYTVRLDPAGYYRCEEPGFHFETNGPEIFKALGQDDAAAVGANFYAPAGFDWLLPRPKQWAPDWYKYATFPDCLMGQERWLFYPEMRVEEFEPTAIGGEAGHPGNKWLAVPQVPDDEFRFDARDYSELFQRAGVNLPDGFKTIAMAGHTPVGEDLSGADYHPYLQLAQYPAPHDIVAFGFAQFCLLFTGPSIHLLRSPTMDGQTWEHLGSWDGKVLNSRLSEPQSNRQPVWSMVARADFNLRLRSCMVLPVGYDHLELHLGDGAPVSVKLRSTVAQEFYERLFLGGGWWIAAAPGQKLAFQCQVVAYDPAILVASATKDIFNLGDQYKPTIEPALGISYKIDGLSAQRTALSTQNHILVTQADTGQQLEVALQTPDGALWSSDGTNYRGGFGINLVPGNPGASVGYLAPQLRIVDLRFPVKLTERVSTPLDLDDTEYRGWRAEKSLYEPLGGRIAVDLWDAGLAILESGNLDQRGEYPVHILEDTDGDDVPDTLRIAGWVEEPEFEVLATEGQARPDGSTLAEPIQFYRLHGKGVLAQGDRKWLYLPQMVNPATPGYIEAPDAIKEALLMAGIDVDDAARVFVHPHPLRGTAIARLPGAKAGRSGEPWMRVDSPWAPDWDQTHVQYADYLAVEWLGWLVSEQLDGRINVMPDLGVECLSGGRYYRSATIYLSKAAAAAAGYPEQFARGSIQHQPIQPAANVIRFTGKEQDGRTIPSFIDRDTLSLTDATYENFVGQEKVWSGVNKLGVSTGALSVLSRVALLKLSRRRRRWSPKVENLAPWQFGPTPIDVGRVVLLPNRGDCVIVHLEVEHSEGRHTVTTATAEKLSSAGVLSGTAGAYPGAGA